jgi:glutamate-1-semialdehyde 2,1-aminomutase
LTTLGKIIGGGLPVGAVGGSAEIMSIFDPRQPDYVPHHGTFNGNLLTMAAGCVSLDLLPAEEIERINRLGEQLAAGLTSVFSEANSDFSVTGVGSLVLVHAPDLSALLRFHQAGLEEGLYFAPRGLMNISTPMDGDVIEEVLTRANRSVARVRERSVARAAG